MGERKPRAECSRAGLYQPSMKLKQAIFASACDAKRRRSSNSHSRVAKKLSHIALSSASPTDPIDGRTPASLQRLPNASEVYCLSSTGRRNSSVRRFHKLVQSLGRCSPSKRLARTTVQRCRHGGKRVDAVHAQVRALRKVLAQ